MCYANAEQAYVYTYQGNPFTVAFDLYSPKGAGNGSALLRGIAFSIMPSEPLVADQAITLSNEDIYPADLEEWYVPEFDTRNNRFSGVMGANGAFQSWEITSSNGFNINERSVFSMQEARDSKACCSSIQSSGAYNLNTPGTWTRSIVETASDSAYHLNSIYRIDVTTPLPEASSAWMAVLRVAAVSAVTRGRGLTA